MLEVSFLKNASFVTWWR